MTKYITIVLIAFFIACNDKQQQIFNIPSRQELSHIIKAVIYQDSLPVLKVNAHGEKNTKQNTSYPLSINLRKLKVIFSDTTKTIPEPIDRNVVSAFKILDGFKRLKYEPNENTINPKVNYGYLLFQNNVLNNFEIKSDFPDNLILTTYVEQQNKRKQELPRLYYDLTIPILSLDGKNAYVEVTFNCSGLCGGATAIYLKKENKEWRITKRKSIWRS